MRNRSSLFAILMALAVLPPGLAAAQKLDKDDKKWLDDVRPIVLAEEEKTTRASRTRATGSSSSRSSGLAATPTSRRRRTSSRWSISRPERPPTRSTGSPGSVGSNTDCGRTFILLGKPDEVQDDAAGSPGYLAPQTWTYRDRPGQTFQGGKAVIAFDPECRAPAGFSEQLDRIAAAKVLQPNIDYRVGKDGHLDEARRPAPEGHRGPGSLQAAAPGLRDRAPGLVPEGRRRRHGAARPRAWRRGRPRDGAERRREDRERVGRGQRGGRGREGSRLDGADDDPCGGRRRLLPGRLQAGPEGGQVHAEGGGGGRQGRQGLARRRCPSRCRTSRRWRPRPTAPP